MRKNLLCVVYLRILNFCEYDKNSPCSVPGNTKYAPSHWYRLHPCADDENQTGLADLKLTNLANIYYTSNTLSITG